MIQMEQSKNFLFSRFLLLNFFVIQSLGGDQCEQSLKNHESNNIGFNKFDGS